MGLHWRERNLPEKEKADHDPSFCFHILSLAVLASIPKRLSHNLLKLAILLSWNIKRVAARHTCGDSLLEKERLRIDFKKKRDFR